MLEIFGVLLPGWDDLADYFNGILDTFDLVDVAPCVPGPTWTNGRAGMAGIHKRLDKFLVKSSLLNRWEKHRSWIGEYKFSDHWPVLFQIDNSRSNLHYPFKFNCSWLNDEDFCTTIKEFWINFSNEPDLNPIDGFVQKLRMLKDTCSVWIKKREKSEFAELISLEHQLQDLHCRNFVGGLMEEEFQVTKHIERKKEELLIRETQEWRLKSRALWFSHGDGNTIFFHSYASHRRNMNVVWDLNDDMGNVITGQDAFHNAAYEFYGKLYADIGQADLL